MKKLMFSLIGVFMLSITVQAQSNADNIKLLQNIFGKEKTEVVKSFIKPSPETATAFWEVYESYDAAMKELGTKRFDLLQSYADSYGKTTDADTDILIKEMVSITKSSNKLLNSYYKKLKKISPLDAAQFYQVESYIGAKVRATVLEQIPFFGEFE